METSAAVETRPAGERLREALAAPVRAFRLAYLPLLMVYFAYGALGIVAVAESFWVKTALTMTPAELASLAVWLTLPWAVKMVLGELVDTVPILGSQRRAYVFIGASMIAASLVLLAGTAGGWITVAPPEVLFVTASLVSVVGVVLQDVVADAMSTEVVPRTRADGSPRPKEEIDHDLGMVQVLGRLALSLGIFVTAGLSGWLAQIYSYETVFLLGLVIPAISASGALLVKLETTERRPTDWRILGGGLAFGLVVMLIGLAGVPYREELVFVISMTVVVLMLKRVTAEVDVQTRLRILYAALIIFAFRATPGVGEGYRWFTIDVLGFDEAFYGTLQQIGATIALVATWLLSDAITRHPVAVVLLWLTLLGSALSIPNLLLVFGAHEYTEQAFGIGARTIALVDTAAESPLAQLGMIPLLTLIAIYAPARHRATWFALMASFMNLALVAGQLITRYLNEFFVVDRGQYAQLPALVVTAVVLGLIIPLAAILAFGRRVR
jgi:MFS family permease